MESDLDRRLPLRLSSGHRFACAGLCAGLGTMETAGLVFDRQGAERSIRRTYAGDSAPVPGLLERNGGLDTQANGDVHGPGSGQSMAYPMAYSARDPRTAACGADAVPAGASNQVLELSDRRGAGGLFQRLVLRSRAFRGRCRGGRDGAHHVRPRTNGRLPGILPCELRRGAVPQLRTLALRFPAALHPRLLQSRLSGHRRHAGGL